MIRGMLGQATEHIDAIAQDLWGVGCLMYEMLTGHQLFLALARDDEEEAAMVCNFHRELVRRKSCVLLHVLYMLS